MWEKETDMPTAVEIQKAITDLPKSEYDKLIHWLQDYDWDVWGRELEENAEAGRLRLVAGKGLDNRAAYGNPDTKVPPR